MKKILFYVCSVILFISLLIISLGLNNNFNDVNKSVVYIESLDNDSTKNGSGFVYKIEEDKTYIVTSYHVIEGYNNTYIYNSDKNKVKANVLNYDEYTDIAILTIDNSLNLKEINIGNSDKVSASDKIYVVGTPVEINNINTVSKGNVMSVNKKITVNTTHGSSNLNVIEINAKVDYGNSGGPLLNKNKEVIGMMFIKEDNSGLSYALPINFVMDIVEKLEKNELKRPSLGAVMCNTTNIELLRDYNIEYVDINGVVLLEINNLSILNKVGLKKGDIITKFDDNMINDVNKLREELYKKKIGDTVEIEYYRDGNYYKENIKL